MSSNPFRRSQTIGNSDSPAPSVLRHHADADAQTTTPPRRTKKRVQILSPPQSPDTPFIAEDGNRRLSASSGRSNSPPPPPGILTEDDDASDSSIVDPGLRQAQINTRRNSATLDAAPISIGSLSGIRAPYNPFARTLATSEASHGIQPIGGEDRAQAATALAAAAEHQQSGSRPAMDVDMFKNILLTGSAPPPPVVEAISAAAPPRSQGSSSGTDASSFSRHSLFDSGNDFRSESPRTSFDDYESASDGDEGDHNEGTNLMGPGRSEDIAPPAPPKPKARGPQTVSFADFDQAIPSAFPPPAQRKSPVNANVSSILRPSPTRSSSDLNKPLPLPPLDITSLPDASAATINQPPSPHILPAGDASQLKKVPPPPPASRRQAVGPGRPRSSSSGTQDSNPVIVSDASSDASSELEESFVKVPPPPPPARKAQAPASNQSHSPSPNLPAKAPAVLDAAPKAMPPPPPRRQQQPPKPAPRASGSARTSIDSLRPAAAPPVPPPPRRGAGAASKRDSMDSLSLPAASALRAAYPDSASHRRPSTHSIESQRSSASASQPALGDEHRRAPAPELPHSPSASSLPAAVPAAALPPRDLLADLTAFQAEIDALRAESGPR